MYEVEIKRMDHQGRGIGYIDNKVTFIDEALPGEIVFCDIIKETPKYNEAKITKIKKKSLKRVQDFCPYFHECGGCNLQQMEYKDTLNFKIEKIENIFERLNIDIPKVEIVKNSSPKNYRNKLSLKIKESKIGFFKSESHNLIEILSCAIAKDSINKFIKKIKLLNIKNGEITIRSNYNDELLISIKTADDILFNENEYQDLKIVGVVVNDKTIYGQNFFYERIKNHLFKVSYDAFFQVNSFITRELFSILADNIKPTNHVLDLYSGVGTLGIIASDKAKKVYSIEIIKNAVLDNIENKKLNKKENIFPILGDAGKVLPKIKDKFDTIIIDPPRKGLDTNTRNLILNSQAEKIIYISCDPLTLARDLKLLISKYEIQKFYVLDMFSYTSHVECLCVLNLC